MATAPRVRFAPSPTGYLHVGGARTALFNWLYARKEGGVFVLRIEDTDRERSTDASVRTILEGMTWLGLHWDEGPFHQADGFARHKAEGERLLAEGKAYRCFCTPETLQAKREAAGDEYRYDRTCLAVPVEESDRRAAAGEPFTVRFRVPEGETAWDDAVHGELRFRNADIDDFIVLRTDGTPIYNMAVVSDDIDMRITHVIRGDDHIPNTPKQILLYQALGAAVPVFGHLPMILGEDGRKLSKRHGATAVGDYADLGILPEALFNFLALLGWNPGDDREVMAPDELVEAFTLERINKKSAVFDTAKLQWMNGQYLARKAWDEVLPLLVPLWEADGLLAPGAAAGRTDELRKLVEMLKTRGRTTLEVARLAGPYLSDAIEYDADAVAKHWKDAAETSARLGATADALAAVEPWEPAGLEAALRTAAEAQAVGFGKVVHPLRLALVGQANSPGIDAVLDFFGRDRTLARIAAARARLGAGGE
jgi:glutamyl-tRNA synthetase